MYNRHTKEKENVRNKNNNHNEKKLLKGEKKAMAHYLTHTRTHTHYAAWKREYEKPERIKKNCLCITIFSYGISS